MNWSNIRLILAREIRDQLRDRRTLFMIFVLPMLLYPLLGMSMFQATQFMQEQASRVLVLGADRLAGRDELPPLFDPLKRDRFDAALFSEPGKARLLELQFAEKEDSSGNGPPFAPSPSSTRQEEGQDVAAARGPMTNRTCRGVDSETISQENWSGRNPRTIATQAVQAGRFDAAIYFPPDFLEKLGELRRSIQQRGPAAALEARPEIVYSSAKERSQIASARLHDVLARWTEEIGRKNLTDAGIPPQAAHPFDATSADVADQTGFRGAAVWSKVLPVLLLIWALTGAFYPAVDLCAGEKERGTLETLLCSPAERMEIVLGKLGTIMLFSVVTAALNLLSMGITGTLVLTQIPQFGPPPLMALVWLPVALVPMSALFSALCLALAAFARSTKEGQYYLMPLLLITMPLVLLPIAPGVELNLGNSLIPVTGVVLLLRALLEGNYWLAVQYLPPVAAVTLAGCILAVRWAVEQFNSESVLFRESERLDVSLWLRHLVADRRPTPSVAEAVFCGLVILLLRFFLSFAVKAPGSFRDFAVVQGITQLAVVLAPPLLMAVMLTRSPRRTLLWVWPGWMAIPAAAVLAAALHPAAHFLEAAVMRLYAPGSQITQSLGQLEKMLSAAPFWQLLVIMAAVPALCEELAFRGFILSGFRHLGHKWRAIVYSALFFGLSHVILQQWITAFLLGLVIGYVAVQSGSLWPAMVFHFVHNGLTMASTRLTPELLDRWPALGWLFGTPEGDSLSYTWPAVVLSAVLAVAVLLWFHWLAYQKSEEETQQAALVAGLRPEGGS